MDSYKKLEHLVQRCQSGDRDAFESLVVQYHPRLKYFVRRLDGTSGNADDLLQEIWMSVFKKIHKLKEPRLFPVWLYRIARNRVYRGFRRKERYLQLPEEKELPVSCDSEPTFDVHDAERIHEALKKLKPHLREVLTLYYLEQMSYESIAQVTRCRIGTIRSRLFYAKQSLREKMETHNE
jgi:RNA polymerase sigma-70 factor (ECF subfamily)